MARLSTEAKLGLFVLLGIILLAYMSLSVGRFNWFGGGYEIKATFDSVAGLKKDVPVEIAGVEVGRVADISLKGDKALVTMRIHEDVKIPKGSTAVIQTKGILGEKFIELIPPRGGPLAATTAAGGGGDKENGRYVQPGGEITKTYSAPNLDRMLRTFSDVAEDIKAISRSLSGAVAGPEGERKIRDIVDNIRDMTENLSHAVAENRAQFREMIDNFSSLSADLRQLTAENRGRVSDTLANFQEASGQLERAMASLERLAQGAEEGKGVVGTLMTDQNAADDLQSTLASLRDISDKVNEGKGTLGKLINDETTVQELNNTLEGFGRYQQKFEDFKTYLGFRGEYLTRSGDGKGYLTLKVQPKRDKYYLLEILRDPGFTRDNQKVLTTTTTTGSSSTTTVISSQETEEDEIKFSAEVAKRFYDVVVRGGIIESSAGLAADYYLLGDNLRLTFEAFDFGRDEGAHYKAYANYNFLKYFFITAGYDDFGVSERASPLVGGGLTFLDDDIKYLITGAPVAVTP